VDGDQHGIGEQYSFLVYRKHRYVVWVFRVAEMLEVDAIKILYRYEKKEYREKEKRGKRWI